MTQRIGFVLPSTAGGAPAMSALTAEVVARLGAHADVRLIQPDSGRIEIATVRPSCDLYVLKSRTPVALAFAAILDARGARTLNTYRSSALARDKIASTAFLAAAGVRVPPSFATATPAVFDAIADRGACWLKPSRGSRGAGVVRAASAVAWRGLPMPEDAHGLPAPLFAQLDVPAADRDLKVYVVGEELWGIARVYPARTAEEKRGAPVVVPAAVADAARRCGRALGLEIYGVDVVGDADRFWIVDVNAYPGFKGVDRAGEAIAQHVLARARAGREAAVA